MEKRVVITGIGVVSPLGHDVATFWNNLQKGVCAIRPIQNIPTEGLKVSVAAEITDFDPASFDVDKGTMRRADRYSQFALAAASQAMADSGLECEPERFGVYVGSGVGGIHTLCSEHEKMLTEGVGRVSPLSCL